MKKFIIWSYLLVVTTVGSLMTQAEQKSAIFSIPHFVINKFAVFMTQCIIWLSE